MELIPVQKVFSLPEMVSLILEYSASGQKPNVILQLRTVCHLWRRMAFRALLSNKIVAVIYSRRRSGFYNVHKSFPPDCYFPMKLLATNRDLEAYEVQFIKNYAHNFISVEIQGVDVVSVNLPSVDKLAVELPNLKLMDIQIPNHVQFSEDNPLHQLIEDLAENASRLETFKLGVNLWDGDTLPSKVLRKVTSLSVTFASYSALEQLLLENNLPKLTSLQLSSSLEMDSQVIPRIIRKLSGQLKAFSFPAKDTRSFTDLLSEESRFGVLEKLEITGCLENTPNNVVQEISCIYAKIPTLTQLDLPRLSAPLAEILLPVIFSGMTRLTYLSVSISDTLVTGGPYEIGKLLTGLDATQGFDPEDIEKESPLWPLFLEGNRHSITNLKNLREFKLEVDLCGKTYTVCCIPRFLFRAGFFQMPNLAKITLINCLMNKGLMQNYREETGRELIVFDTPHWEYDSDSNSDSDG